MKRIIVLLLFISISVSQAEYIVVSVKPLELIMNEILPRNFKISTVYSADTIPFAQELKPEIYTEFATADLLIYSSDLNEPQILDIPARHKINISELIPEEYRKEFLYEGEEYINEFFWFNPELTNEVVSRLIDILVSEFPDNAQFLRASAKRFKNKTDLMAEKIKLTIKKINLRPFVMDYNYLAYMNKYFREFKPIVMLQKYGGHYEIKELNDIAFAGMYISEQVDKKRYKKLAIKFRLKYLYFDVYGKNANKYTSLIRNMNVQILKMFI